MKKEINIQKLYKQILEVAKTLNQLEDINFHLETPHGQFYYTKSKGVGDEITPSQKPHKLSVKAKHTKLPFPSDVKKMGGNDAIKDFIKRYKVFHDKPRDMFVKR